MIREVRRRAEISKCGDYRYLLEHTWTPTPMDRVKILTACMLNPSDADEEDDDATVRWLTGWCLKRDYDAMRIVNFAAYRTKSPREMLAQPDPHGPENTSYLIQYTAGVDVLCGWGNAGKDLPRYGAMIEALRFARLKCLTVTKSGAPGHPLRKSHKLELMDWSP